MTDSSSQPPGQPPSGPPAGQGQPQQYQGGPPSYASGPPQGSSGPRASFGQRFGAMLLDWLILGVPLTIIAVILALAVGGGADTTGEVDEGAAGLSVLLYVIIAIAAWAYYVVLEGGPTGQTLGKKAVGIRVVSMQTGGPIGYGKSFVRTLVRSFVSGAICGLGYFWMLWDQEKQTWHDKISDSVVVPVTAYPIQR